MVAIDIPEFIGVDEREDAINTLEHAAEIAAMVESNPAKWKWLIISLHNALQGSLVCTLSGTAGVGALTDKSMAKMLDWFEATRNNPNPPKPPRERLADLMTLYERSKAVPFMQEFGGTPLQTTDGQDWDVKKLNDLRRNFAHFRPVAWSIETAGLPRVILTATGVIETLLLQHPSNTFRLKRVQIARVTKATKSIRKIFAVPSKA